MTEEQGNAGYVQTALVFGMVLMVVYLYQRIRRSRNLPPGPPGLPILGSLPFLGTTDLRKAFLKLREKYGDLVTLQLGMRDVVILNSYDVIKDAFVNANHAHVFSGRPQDIPLMNEISKGCGIINTEGETHREQRKFMHTVLRDFGVGRSLLEDKIAEELNILLKHLEHHMEEPFEPSRLIQNAVSNIICSVVFGKRYEYGDPEFKRQMEIMDMAFKQFGNNNPVLTMNWLRHLPGDIFGVNKLISMWQKMEGMFMDQIEKHRSSRIPEYNHDVIDAYLNQMDKEKFNEKTTFHETQLVLIIGNLFSAGTETTATTLRWAITYLLHNPDIQAKVQQEIKDVIGHRLPCMRDKVNMPYTEAVLLETQRLGDVVPFALPHSTLEDVTFHGYDIPKGTMVIPNLRSAHMDPTLWNNPEKFDPTHFLGKDGKVDKKEYLIPFSMGKRVCLGESMAKMELFLFFTAILQRFTIQVPLGNQLPNLTGILGLTNVPEKYDIMLKAHTY